MYYFVFPEKKKRKIKIFKTCFEINFILRMVLEMLEYLVTNF